MPGGVGGEPPGSPTRSSRSHVSARSSSVRAPRSAARGRRSVRDRSAVIASSHRSTSRARKSTRRRFTSPGTMCTPHGWRHVATVFRLRPATRRVAPSTACFTGTWDQNAVPSRTILRRAALALLFVFELTRRMSRLPWTSDPDRHGGDPPLPALRPGRPSLAPPAPYRHRRAGCGGPAPSTYATIDGTVTRRSLPALTVRSSPDRVSP